MDNRSKNRAQKKVAHLAEPAARFQRMLAHQRIRQVKDPLGKSVIRTHSVERGEVKTRFSQKLSIAPACVGVRSIRFLAHESGVEIRETARKNRAEAQLCVVFAGPKPIVVGGAVFDGEIKYAVWTQDSAYLPQEFNLKRSRFAFPALRYPFQNTVQEDDVHRIVRKRNVLCVAATKYSDVVDALLARPELCKCCSLPSQICSQD